MRILNTTLALLLSLTASVALAQVPQSPVPAHVHPSRTASPEEIVNSSNVKVMLDRFDSLAQVLYFQRLQTHPEEAAKLNKYGFSQFEVPKYSPAQYEERLKKIQGVIAMDYNPVVQGFIDLYTAKSRYTTSLLLGRQHTFFTMFEEILARENMPLELKYLAVIESALNPNAQSWAGALGLWQFMYGTAKMYDVRMDSYVDERKDPYKSTVAAARHLKDLYMIYNDWHLAIAAYNCGPGWVNRAIKLCGDKYDFWTIAKYLPSETRGYVPAFIGAAYAMNYATEHNIYPVPHDFSFNADTIGVRNKQISLQQIAAATGTNLKLLTDLNPHLKLGIIPASVQPVLFRAPASVIDWCHRTGMNPNMPDDKSHLQMATMPGVPPSFRREPPVPDNSRLVYHTVTYGETAQSIAYKYKVNANDLLEWNQLSGYGIQYGYTIKVYAPLNPVTQPAPGQQADPTLVATAPAASSPAPAVVQPSIVTPPAVQPAAPNAAAQGIWHTVRPGETLWMIAQKYPGCSVDIIARLNTLNAGSIIYAGQKLRVQ